MRRNNRNLRTALLSLQLNPNSYQPTLKPTQTILSIPEGGWSVMVEVACTNDWIRILRSLFELRLAACKGGGTTVRGMLVGAIKG